MLHIIVKIKCKLLYRDIECHQGKILLTVPYSQIIKKRNKVRVFTKNNIGSHKTNFVIL